MQFIQNGTNYAKKRRMVSGNTRPTKGLKNPNVVRENGPRVLPAIFLPCGAGEPKISPVSKNFF